jgi:hypothetical protein
VSRLAELIKFSHSSDLKMKFASIVAAAFASAPALAVPAGFVTTDGTKFQLDGKDFFFAGSNAYYLPFNVVSYLPLDVDQTY